MNDRGGPDRPRIGFINEDVHGHSTVDRRLRDLVSDRGDINPWFARIPAPNRVEARLVRRFDRLGDLDLQPLRWRLRYSFRTRRVAAADHDSDALYVESQACALLGRRSMRTIPWVVSVDATCRQFAALEYWRARGRFSGLGESAIEALERRAYAGAHAIIAWSEWTAGSLREDFGVPDERIEVVHPGVPVSERLERPETANGERGALRVLFVGNNVDRKGLGVLLEAREWARASVTLDVVTSDSVEELDGVTVHSGVGPDSDELKQRYREADVLAAPTLADCVPLVVAEGMAAGLPVISTDVGAIPELIGDAGVLVPAGDAAALGAAIDRLAEDPARRTSLCERAFARARERFDVRRQVEHLVSVLKRAAAEKETGR